MGVSLPPYQSPLPHLSPCRGPGWTNALGGDAGAAALPLGPPRWVRVGRAEPARPSPPSGPQAAPSLMPLGPRKRFLCPHDTLQSAGKRHRRLRRGRAREPHAPEAKIHGGERDNNSSPSKPSSPREPGWRKDSEGIWRGTYEEGRI